MIAHGYIDLTVTEPATPLTRSPALRWAGLLVAVCVPTVFWVLVVYWGSTATGLMISTPALTVFGLLVSCYCFAVAEVVMGRHLQVVN
jgi:hypothetical protein